MEALKRLEAEVSSYFGVIETRFIKVITLYAFGMAATGRSGQSVIAEFLHALVGMQVNTIRQRLRELTYEAKQKRGQGRHELCVQRYFESLTRWVLSKFAPDQCQLVLAFDATYLGQRFVILSVSVVVSGTAIPLAWHIDHATAKGAWTPIWKLLLSHVQRAVPTTWQVSVLADAGLYSKPLFVYIRDQLHWHPHMRVSPEQGLCRAPGGVWFPLRDLVRYGMRPTAYRLYCFKGHPLLATVVVEWALEYEKPCVVLTDIMPRQATVQTYHLRYWIEAGFKDLKRGGLRWEQTKMTCPKRAERLWLVMSVALLYLTSLHIPFLSTPAATHSYTVLSRPTQAWIHLLARLIRGESIATTATFSYRSHDLPLLEHTYP